MEAGLAEQGDLAEILRGCDRTCDREGYEQDNEATRDRGSRKGKGECSREEGKETGMTERKRERGPTPGQNSRRGGAQGEWTSLDKQFENSREHPHA